MGGQGKGLDDLLKVVLDKSLPVANNLTSPWAHPKEKEHPAPGSPSDTRPVPPHAL